MCAPARIAATPALTDAIRRASAGSILSRLHLTHRIAQKSLARNSAKQRPPKLMQPREAAGCQQRTSSPHRACRIRKPGQQQFFHRRFPRPLRARAAASARQRPWAALRHSEQGAAAQPPLLRSSARVHQHQAAAGGKQARRSHRLVPRQAGGTSFTISAPALAHARADSRVIRYRPKRWPWAARAAALRSTGSRRAPALRPAVMARLRFRPRGFSAEVDDVRAVVGGLLPLRQQKGELLPRGLSACRRTGVPSPEKLSGDDAMTMAISPRCCSPSPSGLLCIIARRNSACPQKPCGIVDANSSLTRRLSRVFVFAFRSLLWAAAPPQSTMGNFRRMTFVRLQLQPKLLLHRGKDRRRVVGCRCFVGTQSSSEL